VLLLISIMRNHKKKIVIYGQLKESWKIFSFFKIYHLWDFNAHHTWWNSEVEHSIRATALTQWLESQDCELSTLWWIYLHKSLWNLFFSNWFDFYYISNACFC
jgi:hypothetical protein